MYWGAPPEIEATDAERNNLSVAVRPGLPGWIVLSVRDRYGGDPTVAWLGEWDAGELARELLDCLDAEDAAALARELLGIDEEEEEEEDDDE
jgi:hypothetical protein